MLNQTGADEGMTKENHSKDLYGALCEKAITRKRQLQKSGIEQLVVYLKRELVVYNYSSLIDAAFLACASFFDSCSIVGYEYTPSSFILSGASSKLKIPAFDAWWIILLLADYMTNDRITEDVERLLPYFF